MSEQVTGKIVDWKKAGVFGKDNDKMATYEVTLDNGKTYTQYIPDKYPFKHKVDDEVDITFEEKEKRNGETYLKASEIKKKGEVTSRSSYNDPNVVKQMAMSISISLAIKYYKETSEGEEKKEKLTQKHITYFAEKLYEWIIGNDISRDIVSQRWYAMEHALEFCVAKGDFNEKLPDLAQQFLDKVNSVTS